MLIRGDRAALRDAIQHAPGVTLVGEHAGLWRWRIGDYRVVARMEDERVTVLVVHRREVYWA